jgi:peptide/nickel transport system permease protein
MSSRKTPLNRRALTLRRFARNKVALIGVALISALALTALTAPILPTPDPDATNTALRLSPPGSSGYIMGSDHLGRDLLSRLLWGSRVTLSTGLFSALIGLVIGTTAGMTAGYMGGLADRIVMRLTDTLMAFPMIILAITVVAALGPGLRNAMIAVGVVNAPFYARTIRAAVLSVREQGYIDAAVAVGATQRRIILRHILPNVTPPILVAGSLSLGWLITETAGLSFLGLGAQPPTADWGSMAADGREFLTVAPYVAIIPGVAITLLVLSFNMVGDAIRDALDPRMQ